MRDIIYKNLTSTASRKKDVLLKEVFEKDGIVARTERRCFYFIKAISHLENAEDLEKLVSLQSEMTASRKRHFYIMKEHSDSLGEDKLVCKIAGTFYAIVEKTVYTIAFLHSFRVYFGKATLTK